MTDLANQDQLITIQPAMLKNLIVAVLLEAIHEAKRGDGASAKWLATPHASGLAESVGFDAALWADIWGNFRSKELKAKKREPKAVFTRNQRLVIEQVAAGYTQQQAAAMVGVSNVTVSVWKRGEAFRQAIKGAKAKWQNKAS